MGKEKISVTVDKEVLDLIESLINDKRAIFRNRSHVIEYSVKKMIEDGGER